ncbi:ABC transporter permease [Streptomyces sp. SID3343]|uniref:ABC transporter permease n=1 Tax=Streptomyces sp. SID3343 TaxID=2690260 RepID=UPI00136F8EE7|nr:ABC transporter permease [Streptomyces sp. SID3343]MYW01324.1 ABC transporter permease subunit [Streptomyces sp. SID3343]
MAAPDLTKTPRDADADAVVVADEARDLAGLEAGLDALETYEKERKPYSRVLLEKALPPVVALLLVLAAWQIAYVMEIKPRYALPSPADVWDAFMVQWHKGDVFDILWTSLSRGALGFVMAVAIGTPLGLVVARVSWIRAAIGPILSGLQSLPSVAWVPPAVIWFGLNNTAIYAVVLLGAVPSIANGLVAGIDQIPPLYLRAGRVLGARGVNSVWHVMLPASLPGYIAGLKQGWAFSWRSLMAAELIAAGPELGSGLGQLLDQGRDLGDMPMMLTAVFMILIVGIGIEMLVFTPIERLVLRQRGLAGTK